MNKSYWGKEAATEAVTAYQQFLASGYWQSVRSQVLERDSHTCQKCSATQKLHVHHLTYAHHEEEHLHLEDLVTLCDRCHADEHGIPV